MKRNHPTPSAHTRNRAGTFIATVDGRSLSWPPQRALPWGENQGQRIRLHSAADVVTARQIARALAMELGFGGQDLTVIASAISDVASGIVDHAKWGFITMCPITDHARRGILIVAHDEGPRAGNVAGQEDFSPNRFPVVNPGLSQAESLMDEVDVSHHAGRGITVTMKKWLGEAGRAVSPRHDVPQHSG